MPQSRIESTSPAIVAADAIDATRTRQLGERKSKRTPETGTNSGASCSKRIQVTHVDTARAQQPSVFRTDSPID